MTFSWTGRDTFSSFDAVSNTICSWNGKFCLFIFFYTQRETWIEKNGSLYYFNALKYVNILPFFVIEVSAYSANIYIWEFEWVLLRMLIEAGSQLAAVVAWAVRTPKLANIETSAFATCFRNMVNKALHPYRDICKMRASMCFDAA